MTTRDHALRLQAEATCARRTLELEDARSALARQAEDAELGRAVRGLAAQVTRLRQTPGVPFGFTPAGVARSVADELAEVRACEPGSPAARGELGDLTSTVLSLFAAHRAPLLTTVMAAASKLARRLDHVDAGATWDDAKRADLGERCLAESDAKWDAAVAKAAPRMPGGELWEAAHREQGTVEQVPCQAAGCDYFAEDPDDPYCDGCIIDMQPMDSR